MRHGKDVVGEVWTIQGCVDGGAIVSADLVRLDNDGARDFAAAILEESGHKVLAEVVRGNSVTTETMLRGLLSRAAAEHDRVKALVDEFRMNADWYNRTPSESSVYRTCALRIEQALESRAEPTDEPIADPAEQAKAVAKELRRRGFYASAESASVAACVYMPDGDSPYVLPMSRDRYQAMGAHAIADEIQAEEARRAREWAGDE